MRPYAELKAELATMMAALAVVEAHRKRVWARIEVLAEDTVTAIRPKARQFGRGRTTWTDADEREYRRQLERFARRFRGELGTLERKAARQRNTIVAFQARHRLNGDHDLRLGLERV
jgi:hypothetical protein